MYGTNGFPPEMLIDYINGSVKESSAFYIWYPLDRKVK